MKDETLGLLVVLIAGALITAFLYTFVLSLRLGMSGAESQKLDRLVQSGDVAGLNRLLVKTSALDTKLEILFELRKIKDPSSVPFILETLAYELPWWGRLWSRIDPSEMPAESVDVRLAAYRTLAAYGDSVTSLLKDTVKLKIGYRQLYAAALLYRLGYHEYKTVLLEYAYKGRKYEEDVYFIGRDLSIDLDVK